MMNYQDKPLRERKVKESIKDLWNKNEIEIKPHARKRMTERNITIKDMKNILWYGRLVDYSMPEGAWRYKLAGKALDNKNGACVVEIEDQLIIVTVID